MCDSSCDSNSVKEGPDGHGYGDDDGHGVGDFVNNNKQRNYAGSKIGPKAGAKTKAGDSGQKTTEKAKHKEDAGKASNNGEWRQGWVK